MKVKIDLLEVHTVLIGLINENDRLKMDMEDNPMFNDFEVQVDVDQLNKVVAKIEAELKRAKVKAKTKDCDQFLLDVVSGATNARIKKITISKTKDAVTYIRIEDFQENVKGTPCKLPFEVVIEVVSSLEIPYEVNPIIPRDVFKQVTAKD